MGTVVLEREIRRNALGATWVGRSLAGARRRVNVDFLAPALRLDAAALDAIERCVVRQAMAARHRGVPRVFAFERGTEEIPPHVVAELSFGRTLVEIERAREGRPGALFSTEEIAWLAVAVGEALEHLHDAGSAHGALTPETVLVAADDAARPFEGGRILVTHAEVLSLATRALARRAQNAHAIWAEDAAAELRHREPFAAPEVLGGADATPSSDAFALAAVLYRASAGVPPLGGTAMPSADTGDARLDAAIARGLGAADEARFATVGELLDAAGLAPSRSSRAPAAPPPSVDAYRGDESAEAPEEASESRISRAVRRAIAAFDRSPRRVVAIASFGWLLAAGALALLLTTTGARSPAQARLRNENADLRAQVQSMRSGKLDGGAAAEIDLGDGVRVRAHRVSRAEFARFCAATGRLPPPAASDEPDVAAAPIQGVSFEDAAAFCRWTGEACRLPSRVELSRLAGAGAPANPDAEWRLEDSAAGDPARSLASFRVARTAADGGSSHALAR